MVSEAAGDSHSARAQRATRWLALLCTVLVTHGSLYPWRFAWPQSVQAAWDEMMNQPSWYTGFGDVISNIVLFVPMGVFGMAWVRGWRAPPWLRAASVVSFNITLAFALQVAQLFVPARDAAWSDVVWNAIGLAIGMVIAMPVLRLPLGGLRALHWRLPIAFVLLWLLLQWWPFVPRLDWQHVKDALKPLLLYPRWRTTTAIDAAVSLTLLAMLIRPLRRRTLLLCALPVLAALGTLLLEHQFLTVSRTVGWFVGVMLGLLSWRLAERSAAWTGVLLAVVWFTVDELRPFQWADAWSNFYWVPFAALLQGSLRANTLALTWQLFWLGAAMVLAHRVGARAAPMAVALGLWALLLEGVQTLLPERVADVTPALLPWLWCLLLPLLQPLTTSGALGSKRDAAGSRQPPELRSPSQGSAGYTN